MKKFSIKRNLVFSICLVLILGSWIFFLGTSLAEAACVTGPECPAGQARGTGPCPDAGQINCVSASSTSETGSSGAPEKVKLENPLGGSGTGEVTSPTRLIGNIIKSILMVVGALALAMFVYGGFTWLTSAGSPEKVKKGKDILIWAVIGLIVIFTSYTAVDFVLTALGV
ncbi:pilin [Patescibacteria group bacterium]|nr:pilin [Patescibacteria group bacterium]